MPALGPPQVLPPAPLLPQRSATQIVPSGAVVTLAVDPHFRPAGSWPQSTPGRNGFGESFGAPSNDLAGSCTGYRPGGKIGSCPRAGAAVAGGLTGLPHVVA